MRHSWLALAAFVMISAIPAHRQSTDSAVVFRSRVYQRLRNQPTGMAFDPVSGSNTGLDFRKPGGKSSRVINADLELGPAFKSSSASLRLTGSGCRVEHQIQRTADTAAKRC